MPPKKSEKNLEVLAYERSMDRVYHYRWAQKIGVLFHDSEATNEQLEKMYFFLKEEKNLKQTMQLILDNL